jgi:hypothetical protein
MADRHHSDRDDDRDIGYARWRKPTTKRAIEITNLSSFGLTFVEKKAGTS